MNVRPNDVLVKKMKDKQDGKEYATIMFEPRSVLKAVKKMASPEAKKALAGSYMDGTAVVHSKTSETMGRMHLNMKLSGLVKEVEQWVKDNVKTKRKIKESLNEKKIVDTKAYDAYKKHCKSTGCDDDSVRMCCDQPNLLVCKRLMKDKKMQKAVALYKKAMGMKEDVQTADKKPETYRKADGKMGTRMVPTDRKVVGEAKVECPQCEGKGCDHCDNKGYHMEDSDAVKAFLAKGGKIKKLPPGKAAGYHGKDDPGHGVHGMLKKPDTQKFGTKKKVKSMGEGTKTFWDLRSELVEYMGGGGMSGFQGQANRNKYGEHGANPHHHMDHAKAAFKSGMKSKSAIIQHVQKKTGQKIHPDVHKAIHNTKGLKD